MTERNQEQLNIRKTVTLATLEMVAEAGLPAEVQMSIQLVPEPVTVIAGVKLVIKALRVSATKQQEEANRLVIIAGQSDDPRWQDLFGSKIEKLRNLA